MLRVILMIDYSSEYDRKLLRGIMRYSKENGPWAFYRISSEPMTGDSQCREVIRMAKRWKADAIIGRWKDSELKQLECLNIPIVLQNYHHRTTLYSSITGDYIGTGEMAADYFYSKSFSNFAFFGIAGIVWSDERLSGFKERVCSRGGAFFKYEISEIGNVDRSQIAQWLKSLPVHTALFCCDDQRALMITEICRVENIDVPSQISVLGVDNDDLVCCISDPQISSIMLDEEEGGYKLCKSLHRQILSPETGRFSIVINPIGVVERNSTSYNMSDKVVARLVEYLDAHYSQPITVEKMLKDVPLSRRSIETRFKKAMGVSIYQYVLDCRIKKVAQLLRTTNRSLQEISAEAGISDYNSLLRLFKKTMHCTPSEYRRK